MTRRPLLEIDVRVQPIALIALAWIAPAAYAQQADPRIARSVAASCANCHGTNGVSQGGIPSLAGQTKADLVRKMQDFKAGRTTSTVMTQLAKGYTDEQIEIAASFFAAEKP
jgi:cytochrome c553